MMHAEASERRREVLTTAWPASRCGRQIHGGGFAALRDRAGLMANNYLTTSLRRQKLRRGSGCGSSLRARHQGRVTHKLPADGINKSSPISCCTSPHLSLFSERLNAGVCVCARECECRHCLCVTLCCSRHRSGLELSIDQSGLRAEIKVFLSLDAPVAR